MAASRSRPARRKGPAHRKGAAPGNAPTSGKARGPSSRRRPSRRSSWLGRVFGRAFGRRGWAAGLALLAGSAVLAGWLVWGGGTLPDRPAGEDRAAQILEAPPIPPRPPQDPPASTGGPADRLITEMAPIPLPARRASDGAGPSADAPPGAAVLGDAPPPPPSAEPPLLESALPVPAAPRAAGRWERHALAHPVVPGRPMIAIVIDDLGVNGAGTRDIIALPGPLTLSFMTYAERLPALAAAGRLAGHEILLHVPMEPMSPDIDPGPNALRVDSDAETVRRHLAWGLDRLEGIVGINNHMGSRFTADADSMAVVMAELAARGLVFLDSRTTAATVGLAAARAAGVPAVERDIFLDHQRDAAFIAGALADLEARARAGGSAIAIGHPYPETIAALVAWLPGVESRGLQLVPLSAIIRHRMAAPAAAQAAASGAPAPAR